jgi:hypothetical protein
MIELQEYIKICKKHNLAHSSTYIFHPCLYVDFGTHSFFKKFYVLKRKLDMHVVYQNEGHPFPVPTTPKSWHGEFEKKELQSKYEKYPIFDIFLKN